MSQDREAFGRPRAELGSLSRAVNEALLAVVRRDTARRIWDRDASLWKAGADHRNIILNRLGWLTSVERFQDKLDELDAFTEEIRKKGFTHCVLLGMGGSSLCADVLAQTLGKRDGFLDMRVLDSTDPLQVKTVEESVPLDRTLFLVASKSGTTAEVRAFYRYFASRVKDEAQFVAITDPGTPLAELARQSGFLRTFENPEDIGGRYSALSYFGLVPAALLGVPLARYLGIAREMARACGPSMPPADNPGLWLGAILAAAHRKGHDKMTLIFSPKVRSLGSWIEQLIAESTGKEGQGILPVDGEPLATPDAYGDDRLFVYVRLAEGPDHLDEPVEGLARAGHPVVTIPVIHPVALGGELFRWEMATAVASSLMGINPFDEPNVSEAKELTRVLLAAYEERGVLPPEKARARGGGVEVHADSGLSAEGEGIEPWIKAHLFRARPGDYFAICAFLPQAPRIDAELQALRKVVRDRTGMATTVGYGPRFLHSTGQLHKGGRNNGLFLQITCEDRSKLEVPGKSYGFSVLKAAQAQGDMEALRRNERRVLGCHLQGDILQELKILRQLFEKVVP